MRTLATRNMAFHSPAQYLLRQVKHMEHTRPMRTNSPDLLPRQQKFGYFLR